MAKQSASAPSGKTHAAKSQTSGDPSETPASKAVKPAAHSDNVKSTPPARPDDSRHAAPNDPPGRGEQGEPPVG